MGAVDVCSRLFSGAALMLRVGWADRRASANWSLRMGLGAWRQDWPTAKLGAKDVVELTMFWLKGAAMERALRRDGADLLLLLLNIALLGTCKVNMLSEYDSSGTYFSWDMGVWKIKLIKWWNEDLYYGIQN